MIHRAIWGFLGICSLAAGLGCGKGPSRVTGAGVGAQPVQRNFETPGKQDRISPVARPELDSLSSSNSEEEIVGSVMIKGEKNNALATYDMPEGVRQRLGSEIPTFAKPSKAFQIGSPNLFISAKTSKMIFTGILKISGRKDEKIELGCAFDRSKLWTCGDMYPVDERVKKERRLQATVNCLDSDRCQWVGLQIYVLIDGKVETQLFQTQNFSIRQAESGDASEFDEEAEAVPSEKQPPAKFQGRLPKRGQGETPLKTPAEIPKGVESFEPEIDVEAPVLTEEELNRLLDDPNAAVEIEPPVWTPEPERGNFSIPGIEKLSPTVGRGVRSQAHGSHTAGHLKSAVKLPASGQGFEARKPMDQAYGTDLMMEMIQGAAAKVAKSHPGSPPIVIASISKSTGGTLLNRSKRAHRSHKNGLDVDVVFPSSNRVQDMWPACSTAKGSCPKGSQIRREFDEARFWKFAKEMTCAKDNPVRVMFIDAQIKRHLCNYVRSLSSENLNDPSSCAHKTLKAMKHSPGHHNHVHIRLRCPGNRECQERTFDLGRGTGC